MNTMTPSSKLAKSREALAAGLLALARNEIGLNEMEKLEKDCSTETKKARAGIKTARTALKSTS